MKSPNNENVKNKTYIVKLPKYLGEEILKCKNNEQIGTFKYLENNKVEFELDKKLKLEKIPIQHTVTFKNRITKGCVMNDSMDIVGNLGEDCYILPVINAEYLKFKNEMKEKFSSSVKEAKISNYYDYVQKGEKYAGIKIQEAINKERKQQIRSRRRERLEKPDVLDLMFKAYEKYSFWTIKDLADFCGQPVAYIQELIGEIADLDKKDHKGTYVLKPQYK